MGLQLTGNGQRWSRRIAVEIPVQVAADGSPKVHGLLKNLSLSGGMVATDHTWSVHTYIEISMKPPEAGQDALSVMARVMRNLKGGVGVEWCEFAPSAVTDPTERSPLSDQKSLRNEIPTVRPYGSRNAG
jgi:PilZ domain